MFDNAKILAFHQTSRRFYPGINNIRPNSFFGLIHLLKQFNVNLWSASDDAAVSSISERGQTTVVLSFDDGYKDNIDILFRLCSEDITPILFMPTAYIGKINRWDYSSQLFPAEHLDKTDIKSLSDAGVIFGSHGVSHLALTSLKPHQAKLEMEESKKVIEEITGREVKLLSYPFGRTSSKIDLCAQKLGYLQGMVLGNRQILRNDSIENIFCIARTAIYSIDNYYSIRSKIYNNAGTERFKNRIINNLAGGTIFSSPGLK